MCGCQNVWMVSILSLISNSYRLFAETALSVSVTMITTVIIIFHNFFILFISDENLNWGFETINKIHNWKWILLETHNIHDIVAMILFNFINFFLMEWSKWFIKQWKTNKLTSCLMCWLLEFMPVSMSGNLLILSRFVFSFFFFVSFPYLVFFSFALLFSFFSLPFSSFLLFLSFYSSVSLFLSQTFSLCFSFSLFLPFSRLSCFIFFL